MVRTENLKHMAKRMDVVLDSDNGTYGITQKWVHNMDFIGQQRVGVLEGFIGRRMNDSIELNPKPASAHIARMTSGPQFNASKPVRMFRQSMPYGRLAGNDQCGLFFIGFANDVNNFEYFLNRMTPAVTDDGKNAADQIVETPLAKSSPATTLCDFPLANRAIIGIFRRWNDCAKLAIWIRKSATIACIFAIRRSAIFLTTTAPIAP
uniref:Dyp-type peroxidase C-terminal domain-containing protein n=1 Tax=Romanomermis culicivorax TaxID=13658 RepID=A0A915K662_ROMCU